MQFLAKFNWNDLNVKKFSYKFLMNFFLYFLRMENKIYLTNEGLDFSLQKRRIKARKELVIY